MTSRGNVASRGASSREGSPTCVALRIGGALAIALLCILGFHRVDTGALRSVLAGASLWQVAAAMTLSLGLQTTARARRTMVMLRTVSGGEIGFWDLFSLLLGGYAAGYLIPGPSEEVLHTAGLTRFGFRFRDLMSVQLIEKSLSVLSIALMALPVLPIDGNSRLVVGFAAAAALVALVIHGIKSDRAIPLDRLLAGLWWVLISNLSSVAMMWLCFSSVGAHPAFSICLKIFSVTACACALPLTPGQVGVLESAFVVVATHLGVAAGTALAAGILYHVAHVVPVVVGGLPAMMRLRATVGHHTNAATWKGETCVDRS
jgi:Lysylphosphatidylglycerol synthase TM region